jgi:hypothetical protein
LFVLDGRGRLGGVNLDVHSYAYLPAAWEAGSVVVDRDLIMLAMFSAAPEPAADGAPFSASRLIGPIDTTMLKWDNSGIDPNINHLHASRKNLRLSPDGDCRTYLLGGMPQGFPPEDTPLETHPHVEEFFMVSGDMSVHCGIMRAGAYLLAATRHTAWSGLHALRLPVVLPHTRLEPHGEQLVIDPLSRQLRARSSAHPPARTSRRRRCATAAPGFLLSRLCRAR